MSDPVRRARQELIRAGLLHHSEPDGVVPDVIMRSWRRSLGNSVDSAAVPPRYEDIDTDSILCRAAAPVLDRWQHQLVDTGTTLFLSDRGGSIVARRTSDHGLLRRLDRVHAAEGFDYSEDAIGTNGLGTSMIEKRPIYVEGSQHYNDALSGLACAAVPVSTPTGMVIGSISLGGPIDNASPLMLSLTREIGQQIEERLRTFSRPQDLALAMSFIRYTNSQRPTVVMDRESLLANTPGLSYVTVDSHVVLWETLNAHNWSSSEIARIRLDSTNVEVTARRVVEGPRVHFVVHFAEPDRDERRTVLPSSSQRGAVHTRQPERTDVILVEGPRGSGRATVAREMHAERSGGRDLEVVMVDSIIPTDWKALEDRLAKGTDVLLRRVDEVAEWESRHLLNMVARHRTAVQTGDRGSTLLLTASYDRAAARVRTLIDEIGPVARTRPLAQTPERIPPLVKRILNHADPRSRHTMSPAALQSLMQWSWPGNITELVEVVTTVVQHVDGAVIERRDLPVLLQQPAPKRDLSLIETAEREAIIKALTATGGNKSEAAALLGIGRTTLYRRLRHFDLDSGESSL
ncbi:sigma-54-dependent Fis family transcriptional regulator [Gordonia aurantiaca]|uniref:sigma-54-dependent Fis family transcriptional regulator n=1 Tax=Gordonia sp. B21 TaxID=3151852 RepID=UPI0032639C91